VFTPHPELSFTVLAAKASDNADVLVGLAVDAFFKALEDVARA
jgi:hypothetical protein